MQNRWTAQAWQALKAAEQTAQGLRHNYIGTEHLLAGLLSQRDTIIGRTLEEFKVEPKELLKLIQNLVAPYETEEEEQENQKENLSQDTLESAQEEEAKSDPEESSQDQMEDVLFHLLESMKDAEITLVNKDSTGAVDEIQIKADEADPTQRDQEPGEKETDTEAETAEGDSMPQDFKSFMGNLLKELKPRIKAVSGRTDEKSEEASQGGEDVSGQAPPPLQEEKKDWEELLRETKIPEQRREDRSLSYTPRLEYVLEEAMEDARERNEALPGTAHLLLAMLRDTECLGTRLLYTMGINVQKLYAAVLGAMGWDPGAAYTELGTAQGGDGNSLTPTLDRFSRDLTALAAEGKLDPVVGREPQMLRLIQILCRRTKNNPCLTGEPGVGKTAIVEALAQRIAQGRVPEPMKDKRLVALDMAGMVAGTKYRGEFEDRIRKLLEEVRGHSHVLLFIDELHTIIGAGGAEGSLDAANILKPALSRGELQVIGATTQEEYRKYIEKDAALERRFAPVVVEEPTREETMDILSGLRPLYEDYHKVRIEDEALAAAVELSSRYISDRFQPDKAIDVMDEAAARAKLKEQVAQADTMKWESERERLHAELELAVRQGDLEKAFSVNQELEQVKAYLDDLEGKAEEEPLTAQTVGAGDIAAVVGEWTKIPVHQLTQSETERLAGLEQELHKRVIGQDEAVRAVAQAVKRGRTGLKNPNRPIGSFLFLGPTGVGKTELSKALAESVFGDEQNMIRVDMSEYMEKHSVSRLIGSPPGYVGFEDGGQLSEKVRRHPYSVVLFDEIEKAHPDVFNILLQVLDDGHITDTHGRKVDFRQTIIIMTSNAGAQAIVEPKKLGFVARNDSAQDYKRMSDGVMEEVRRIFRPEFLNRIDEIMVFHMLNHQEVREIVDLLLTELQSRCADALDITLEISEEVRNETAKAGFDPKYGARPIRRLIQTWLEDQLASAMLEGSIHRTDHVKAIWEDGKVVLQPVLANDLGKEER
ncbi:MAG: AAA family ATPase [Blautia sp.]|nr:AAA family ATPase [Blautia sp.]